MSKKFKGKLCVYCSQRLSSDGDHIFAWEFFLVEHRNNLPKAPACSECNGLKSKLEHYLLATLPFGGRHESARQNLSIMVPKRLEKNKKLHRTLNAGQIVWSQESGHTRQTMRLPFDSSVLMALIEMITRGLLWYYWRTYLSNDDFIEVNLLTRRGEAFFEQQCLALRPKAHIANDLGNGTFCYRGSQGVDSPQISVWKFSVFGGVLLVDDPEAPNETSSTIGVLTGPKRVLRSAEKKAKVKAT